MAPVIAVQVKSLRNFGYVSMQKTKFVLGHNRFLALVLFSDDKPPGLYFGPSRVWETPTVLLVSRDYGGEGQVIPNEA